jgi:DNA polymerase elongation subunit (family B)
LQAFPYFFVQIPQNDAVSALADPSAFTSKLQSDLEAALRSQGGKVKVEHRGEAAAGDFLEERLAYASYVKAVLLCKGTPFYGYQGDEGRGDNGMARQPAHLFARIVLFDPGLIKRAATLLQTGALLGGKEFQPYESHVPYLLQFYIDYNLYGMGLMCAKDVRFRWPLPWKEGDSTLHSKLSFRQFSSLTVAKSMLLPADTTASGSLDGIRAEDLLWSQLSSARKPASTGLSGGLPADMTMEALHISRISGGVELTSGWIGPRRVRSVVHKTSSCELEVDLWVSDLTNPSERDSMLFSLTQRVPEEDNAQAKAVLSLAFLWEQERQRRAMQGATDASLFGQHNRLSATQGRTADYEPTGEASVPESSSSSGLDLDGHLERQLYKIAEEDTVDATAVPMNWDCVENASVLRYEPARDVAQTAHTPPFSAAPSSAHLSDAQLLADLDEIQEFDDEHASTPPVNLSWQQSAAIESQHTPERAPERQIFDERGYESELSEDDSMGERPSKSYAVRHGASADRTWNDILQTQAQDENERHVGEQGYPTSDLLDISLSLSPPRTTNDVKTGTELHEVSFDTDMLYLDKDQPAGDEAEQHREDIDPRSITPVTQPSSPHSDKVHMLGAPGISVVPLSILPMKLPQERSMLRRRGHTFETHVSFPSKQHIECGMFNLSKASIRHIKPHYSVDGDIPTRARVFAGLEFKVPGTGVTFLPWYDAEVHDSEHLPMHLVAMNQNANASNQGDSDENESDNSVGEAVPLHRATEAVIAEDEFVAQSPEKTASSHSVMRPTSFHQICRRARLESSSLVALVPEVLTHEQVRHFHDSSTVVLLPRFKISAGDKMLGACETFGHCMRRRAAPVSLCHRGVARWGKPFPSAAALCGKISASYKPIILAPVRFDATTGAIIPGALATVAGSGLVLARNDLQPSIHHTAAADAVPLDSAMCDVDINQHLTILSAEIHARTRKALKPDPKHDAMVCLCYAIHDDAHLHAHGGEYASALVTGCIVVVEGDRAYVPADRSGLPPKMQVKAVPTEVDLVYEFIRLVRKWDPDILAGFEVQQESFGYIFQRCLKLGVPLASLISRVPAESEDKRNAHDAWGDNHDSGIWVSGRMIFNVWRLMRSELKLNIYTLQSVAFNVLGVRVSEFSSELLTQWWQSTEMDKRWRCIQYLATKCAVTLHVLEKNELVARTSEMARLFGIDFFSVLSRGSQFRVEAVMLRICRSLNYVAPSASRAQVAKQAAMEIQPLILEPQSRIFTSPVIVLDFQSLYPSIIIAYNMCYSTVLGRLSPSDNRVNPKVGFMPYQPPGGVIKASYRGPKFGTAIRRTDGLPHKPPRPDSIYISPNGVLFAPWTARQGVLPRMLQEILDTRIMIKAAMKDPAVKREAAVLRAMNARQFALKMIANVTYGYTAAGFSGRMPCAEIADAIVQTARTTLERAIRLVESSSRWNARVVYGDTDSLFVVVPGRTVSDAFKIGEEIAEEVTKRNPRPMQLKMEKVYFPCVLVAKKRYAGFMYEQPSQREPTIECKGLEMVRRDTCGLVANLMESSMRCMFSYMDLSLLKQHLLQSWHDVLAAKWPLEDFVFAKEVRLGTYSDKGPLPPAAIVASKAMMADPMAEPRFGERIRFVVVQGQPGARLVDLVVSPAALLASPNAYRLNTTYYLLKQVIPALDRIFSLVGADLKSWFAEVKKPASRRLLMPTDSSSASASGRKRTRQHLTIDAFYSHTNCQLCGGVSTDEICMDCRHHKQVGAGVLLAELSALQRSDMALSAYCSDCNKFADASDEGTSACISLDCSFHYKRVQVQQHIRHAEHIGQELLGADW